MSKIIEKSINARIFRNGVLNTSRPLCTADEKEAIKEAWYIINNTGADKVELIQGMKIIKTLQKSATT